MLIKRRERGRSLSAVQKRLAIPNDRKDKLVDLFTDGQLEKAMLLERMDKIDWEIEQTKESKDCTHKNHDQALLKIIEVIDDIRNMKVHYQETKSNEDKNN